MGEREKGRNGDSPISMGLRIPSKMRIADLKEAKAEAKAKEEVAHSKSQITIEKQMTAKPNDHRMTRSK